MREGTQRIATERNHARAKASIGCHTHLLVEPATVSEIPAAVVVVVVVVAVKPVATATKP